MKDFTSIFLFEYISNIGGFKKKGAPRFATNFIVNKKHDIDIAMSSSRADPVMG